MPNNITSDFNRTIKGDFVMIRREINAKAQRFRLPLERKSQDFLDAYWNKLNNNNDLISNEEDDVSKVCDLKQRISNSSDKESFSEEVKTLIEYIKSKMLLK